MCLKKGKTCGITFHFFFSCPLTGIYQYISETQSVGAGPSAFLRAAGAQRVFSTDRIICSVRRALTPSLSELASWSPRVTKRTLVVFSAEREETFQGAQKTHKKREEKKKRNYAISRGNNRGCITTIRRCA